MTDIVASNSLTDLRERLKVEHAAVAGALGTSLHHAMACGDILIEAKAKVKHGQWLSWLESCGISARLAQRYARLARSRAGIEANTTCVSHLGVGSALAMLAVQRDSGDGIVDLVAIADRAVEGIDGFVDIEECQTQGEVHEALRDETASALGRIGEIATAKPALADFIENDPERFAHQLIAAAAEHSAMQAAAMGLTDDELSQVAEELETRGPDFVSQRFLYEFADREWRPTSLSTKENWSRMRDIAVEWLRRIEVEAARI
jgi:hypothetical protein